MNSILLVKTSAIGDVIQTFPVLEYLRLRFPNARIDWIVEKSSAALLSSHPFLDHVYVIDTKLWKKNLCDPHTWHSIRELSKALSAQTYDILFDLQGNTKSALFTLIAKAKEKVGFSLSSVPELANLFATNKRYNIPLKLSVRKRYLALVQSHFEDKTPFSSKGVQLRIKEEEQVRLKEILSHPSLCNPIKLLIATGSFWTNKKLPLPYWKRFLKFIQEELNVSFLFVFGNEQEREGAEELQKEFPKNSLVVGKMSLPLCQALMGSVDGVIGVDSALLHLCATSGTPIFGLFGPSSSAIYQPEPKEKHGSFQGECPYRKQFVHRCPILRTCKTGACLRSPNEKLLFERFLNWSENKFIN